jgi:hypothetical protein
VRLTCDAASVAGVELSDVGVAGATLGDRMVYNLHSRGPSRCKPF